MSNLDGISVNLVDSVEEAERFLSWLSERRPVLAIDTETTGLGWTDTVRLVQFGDAETGWAVPTQNWRGVAVEAMRRVSADRTPLALANAKFDQHKLENEGYDIPAWDRVNDIVIRSRLADPHLRAGLKPVCERLYGKAAVAGADLLALAFAENKWNWATVPDSLFAYWGYGCLDTCLTARAEEHYRPLTDGPAYEREMAVLAIMYGAESRGMRVDPDYTTDLLRTWRAEADVLLRELQAGGLRNPSSNAQVTEALKEVGWEPEEFTDTGLPRLDKAILLGLEGRFGDLAVPLLRYRRLIKWCSTYLDTFLRDRDGADHVHPSINTMGARTGRKTVTNPPMQTAPRASTGREIRNCFVPDDGYDIWCCDYDAMEQRKLADLCRDPGLIQMFLDGEDPHTYCASLAYGIPQDEVPDDKRSIAKNANYARIYGAGPAKIAATAGVPVDEIKAYQQGFDARFPGVQPFIDRVSDLGKRRLVMDGEPWVRTSGGRRLVADPDKIYSLVNYLIQGSCADLFKSAIVALDAVGLSENILMPVHDELVFQFPSTPEGAEQAALAKETMQDLTTYRVPFTCHLTGPLDRWGAA